MRHLIDIVKGAMDARQQINEDVRQGDDVVASAVEQVLDHYSLNGLADIRHELEDYVEDSDLDDEDDGEVGDDYDASDDDDVSGWLSGSPVKNETAYRNALPKWAEDTCFEKRYELRSLLKNGHIPVWRMITAPADWKPGAQPLGLYWAWKESAAEAHWGQSDGASFLMHGLIANEDIDWARSIAMNTLPGFADECEIALLPGHKVHLLWYQRDRKKKTRVEVNAVMETEEGT